MLKSAFLFFIIIVFTLSSKAQGYILIPMDENQTNHMKAYGITYQVLAAKQEAFWLLNYQGGSFAFQFNDIFKKECIRRGVSYKIIPTASFNSILNTINDPQINMEAMKLEVAPKIAVYSPTVNARGNQIQPWDDAVTLVLTYAEIPYDLVYDDEALEGKLNEYDWLHLHHEDFTGQYGKFFSNYSNQKWYKDHVLQMETLAKKHGFAKVSQLKLAVVKKIREFVSGGGFMFAMCSATDTYDIALAADGLDICDYMYDGDAPDPDAQNKLNFNNTFAFKGFKLVRDPLKYEFSTIDASQLTSPPRRIKDEVDYFTLFDFSAKWDPIPTMLTQSHTKTIKGFMGQTTAFRKSQIKSNVLILGENKPANEARYIHGTFQKGFWSFYGGHDPEDYRHFVKDPPTDLELHKQSAGYRLILNNVLFPAAKKKPRKT
ncbi:MAG: asparagine synthetase B [Saprospiraceae bacterium]|nr:asparagine synthetase B [Saprospiraceae bacterium]